MSEKVKLTKDDWDVLLGTNEITVGKTILRIQPLSITNLFNIVESLKSYAEEIGKEKIDLEDSSFMFSWVKKVPDILSDIIGLSVEDVNNLPGAKVVEIVNKIVDTENDLIKNLSTLLGKINTLQGKAE